MMAESQLRRRLDAATESAYKFCNKAARALKRAEDAESALAAMTAERDALKNAHLEESEERAMLEQERDTLRRELADAKEESAFKTRYKWHHMCRKDHPLILTDEKECPVCTLRRENEELQETVKKLKEYTNILSEEVKFSRKHAEEIRVNEYKLFEKENKMKLENEALRGALDYMADPAHYFEEGMLKRPGGYRQEGIFAFSAEVKPWAFAKSALKGK